MFMEPQDIVLELKRLGMTQVEIASAAQCSQATISDIENGRQKRGPSYRMVARLNELLEKKRVEIAAESNNTTDDAQVPTGGRSERKPKQQRLHNSQ
jgi:transcriptional regulator with XRE-family HTH domain